MTITTQVANQAYRVYSYILSYKKEHDGNSPSIREICSACEISSTSVARYYLNVLEKHGLIRVDPNMSRMISVTGGEWRFNHANST